MKNCIVLMIVSSIILLNSCQTGQKQNPVSEADSLRIISNFKRFTATKDTLPKQGHFESFSKQKSFSDIISPEEARKYHSNYLSSFDRIYNDKGQVLENFSIEEKDFKVLSDNGKDGGIKIYFCLEDKNISLIAVPQKKSGDVYTDVLTVGGSSVIVNKLKPCPPYCKKDVNEPCTKCNSVEDLNYNAAKGLWCKPNFTDADEGVTGWWVDEDNKPKEKIH